MCQCGSRSRPFLDIYGCGKKVGFTYISVNKSKIYFKKIKLTKFKEVKFFVQQHHLVWQSFSNGLRQEGRKQLLFPEPEEEYKQREVCSPDFFKNLNAKYQAEKKERDGDDCLSVELKNFIVKIRCFRFESTSASS